MTSCLQWVSKAISPATAFILEQQQSQLRMAYWIIKFKPWGDGQAWLIYHTYKLQQSRYLNHLSSFHGQLLIDSVDQIHQDLHCVTDLAQFISD